MSCLKKIYTLWYQTFTTSLTCLFKILLFCPGQMFLKYIFLLCFVCLWKRMLYFFISLCSSFLTELLLSILYQQPSPSFQLSSVLYLVFRHCYGTKSNVYYSSPSPLKIKTNSFPYFKFKRKSLAHKFSKNFNFAPGQT